MKQKLDRLSRRYAEALRKHLKQGRGASFRPARGLGREAVGLGLETLDLARIHERALAALAACSGGDRIIQRTKLFFAEAVTPIEKTHSAARKSNTQTNQESKKLDRRAVDLAASNRSLKQNIVRRKTVERALRKSGGHTKKLLEESKRLQEHLQHLAHQVLAAQEDKRRKISHELQDEIAQTLLGINVRLVTLKQEAAGNAKGFKKDIVSTQRLVEESVQSINRFAREIEAPQPA